MEFALRCRPRPSNRLASLFGLASFALAGLPAAGFSQQVTTANGSVTIDYGVLNSLGQPQLPGVPQYAPPANLQSAAGNAPVAYGQAPSQLLPPPAQAPVSGLTVPPPAGAATYVPRATAAKPAAPKAATAAVAAESISPPSPPAPAPEPPVMPKAEPPPPTSVSPTATAAVEPPAPAAPAATPPATTAAAEPANPPAAQSEQAPQPPAAAAVSASDATAATAEAPSAPPPPPPPPPPPASTAESSAGTAAGTAAIQPPPAPTAESPADTNASTAAAPASAAEPAAAPSTGNTAAASAAASAATAEAGSTSAAGGAGQTAAIPPSAPVEGQIRIIFPQDSAEVPEKARPELDALAQKMTTDENMRLQLLAYASGAPEEASRARRMSLSRALAVRSYLIKQGVRSTRMDVRALGNNVQGSPADRVDVIPKAQ